MGDFAGDFDTLGGGFVLSRRSLSACLCFLTARHPVRTRPCVLFDGSMKQ